MAIPKTLQKTRNIGISAHIDSGKTTLSERILFYSGRIHRIEEVKGGGDGATMDHMDLEREKGITITSANTTVEWAGHKVNLIDTPGHVDFTVEVERSLRVLDGAIMVLCGVSGVQSQSITVDRQMKRYRVPRLAFINKLDRTGANPFKVVADIREKLGLNAIMMEIPIGLEGDHKGLVDLLKMKAYYFHGDNGEQIEEAEIPAELLEKATEKRTELLEAVSMFDEKLMEKLLEGQEPTLEEAQAVIRRATMKLEMVPVFMGSAFKNKGVQLLLDGVVAYLPSPIDCEWSKGKVVGNEEQTVTLEPDPDKPLVAMAFKLTEESFGQLSYTRIYQGTLKKGMTLLNPRTGQTTRLGRLVRMHANDRENIDAAQAGDIVAMVGIDCASGDTFCDPALNVVCESMFVAKPVISFSIVCPDSKEYEKMIKALSRFRKEDPTFHMRTDEESGETIVSGMGELHVEIYAERIRREYGINVTLGAPQVNYREAITKRTDFAYTHKKQTGGSGQFAAVMGDIEPIEYLDSSAEAFVFEDEVKGGNIPKEFIGSVEKGFRDVIDKGPLAAFPVVGVRAVLRDGKYHDVDSSDMAFRICARRAMRQAIRDAAPQLLEPMMRVEVETPEEYQGSVIGDLSSRRGIILGMDSRGNVNVVNATVPLAEMFGYSTTLRSMSSGKATYSMEFEKYSPTPRNVQDAVLEARKKKLAADED
jgi:elongation factor G